VAVTGFEPTRKTLVVGVLSDTHGQLGARALELLRGADHILHAGDIGSAKVLSTLKTIAPVTAVRGNCDLEAWAQSLPLQVEVELGGVRILMGHIAGRLRERLLAGGDRCFRVVVSGHSHRMEDQERDGVRHLNPGSAGPERFGHPRTLARLFITPGEPGAQGGTSGASPEIRVEFAVLLGER
jgi:putative phosphoesterase